MQKVRQLEARQGITGSLAKGSRCRIQLALPEADVARLASLKTGWREERHAEAALSIARRLILECLHPGFAHGGTQLLAYGVVAGAGHLMQVGRERRLVQLHALRRAEAGRSQHVYQLNAVSVGCTHGLMSE